VHDVLEHGVAVLLVLCYLVDEGDGVVVVQGRAVEESDELRERACIKGSYYSTEMSAPAKAKSQSCFLQPSGEVNPFLTPQFVRNSAQLGPPSAVAV
jgi:hypothetical protein